ncbi:MAG: NTP transferase domain-containing protein [Spirochaetes bacterium]|nr:NTP transferase domain-containing protein [Spirochaetota bacterium]
MSEEEKALQKTLDNLSDPIDPSSREISIILAAGHGKRIKSEKSKMLHEIWGKPSVLRVSEAARKGLSSGNQVIVVGEKALDVASSLGRKPNRIFVYQKEQRGTGDAIRTALQHPELKKISGTAFIIPGDMGLLTERTVKELNDQFRRTGCDMLVTTGYHHGSVEDNYYGRILKSRHDPDSIIEIKEHRDILAMDGDAAYTVTFRGEEERFSPNELLDIREFNVGIYAIKLEALKKLIGHIESDNVQGELYVTDLIKIFNDRGLKVCSSRISNNDLALSFNVKSVLKKMDATFRNMVYERLKDIVTIDDPDDFFIAEEALEWILKLDSEYPAHDIQLGKGVFIGENVQLGRGNIIEKNAILRGNLVLGSGVRIGENVNISTHPDQTMVIGDACYIYRGNVIQGNVRIGKDVRIETGVRITGSTNDPVIIHDNVVIKGMTYIYGSVIEDDLLIEHSILKNRYVEKVLKKDGTIQPVKYILPHPEGLDSISSINNSKK